MPTDASARFVMHGLKSCDTCRKAQKWFQDQGLDFRFHDLRADGLSSEQLVQWLATESGPLLLNGRSTSWRQLSEKQKASADTHLKDLLLEHPTLIKRPVITRDGELLTIGFNPNTISGILES